MVTDPPYKNNCDYSRFSGSAPIKGFNGRKHQAKAWKNFKGAKESFDPTPFLDYPHVVLWGYQHFANRLPNGSLFVWNKRPPSLLGKWCSDGEVAWKKGGCGVYIFNHVWHGIMRDSEQRQKSLHPTQKPVALFKWVLSRLKLAPGSWVYDPFAGSGACGVAALELGLNYYGVELDFEYYKVARGRLAAAKAEAERRCTDGLSA